MTTTFKCTECNTLVRVSTPGSPIFCSCGNIGINVYPDGRFNIISKRSPAIRLENELLRDKDRSNLME